MAPPPWKSVWELTPMFCCHNTRKLGRLLMVIRQGGGLIDCNLQAWLPCLRLQSLNVRIISLAYTGTTQSSVPTSLDRGIKKVIVSSQTIFRRGGAITKWCKDYARLHDSLTSDIMKLALNSSSTPASATTVPVVYAGVSNSKKMSKETGVVKQVVVGVRRCWWRAVCWYSTPQVWAKGRQQLSEGGYKLDAAPCFHRQ